MDTNELIDKELIRLYKLFEDGYIHDGHFLELTTRLYSRINRTTEGATQNSLAGEHGYDNEVAANREMIG